MSSPSIFVLSLPLKFVMMEEHDGFPLSSPGGQPLGPGLAMALAGPQASPSFESEINKVINERESFKFSEGQCERQVPLKSFHHTS